MIRSLILAFIFFAHAGLAQNPVKKHFVIHPIDNSADVTKYENAANTWGQLDQYRLLDKRRTISFSDHKATIELYSATELKEMYGKEVSPLTITSGNYREIEFDVTLDGKGLKPQFVKY